MHTYSMRCHIYKFGLWELSLSRTRPHIRKELRGGCSQKRTNSAWTKCSGNLKNLLLVSTSSILWVVTSVLWTLRTLLAWVCLLFHRLDQGYERTCSGSDKFWQRHLRMWYFVAYGILWYEVYFRCLGGYLTRYGLVGSGFEPQWLLDFSRPSILASSPTRPSVQFVPFLFRGREARSLRWPSFLPVWHGRGGH